MATVSTFKAPVLIPFVCPICAGENGAHLLSISRANGMDCAACGKWLRASDVMRAMHSPREARAATAPPMRTREVYQDAPRAPTPEGDAFSGTGARIVPSRRDRITWPPTPAMRAAANAAAKRA